MTAQANIPDFHHLAEQLNLIGRLRLEQGTRNLQPVLRQAEQALRAAIRDLEQLPPNRKLQAHEPDDLMAIRRLRPAGPRRLETFNPSSYLQKLEGALLGRMAGCTLGAPVELWPVERMEAQARENGDAFPPVDYWTHVADPWQLRYGKSPNRAYLRREMQGVPVDDDIVYTLLGLLVLEQYGPDFTVKQLGQAWVKYLPMACTAEDVTLRNLRKGVAATKAGKRDNPFCEWIGADIRSDAWGYAAPGWPERAAEMAWRDGVISHERNGIYGEMLFSAAIAAAFVVDDPLEAIRLGLTEIPRACRLADAVAWALAEAPKIKDFRQARQAVDAKFPGMHWVHTINNACLTVFGLAIGGTDFTRVISEIVAMGLDNDCTAATAGSIVGAIVGKRGIPRKWYSRFNNTVWSYLNDEPEFKIDDLLRRFTQQAERVTQLQLGAGRKGRQASR
jgi:ADP-ribosylglycohydrolase